jgi:hypothetical protein
MMGGVVVVGGCLLCGQALTVLTTRSATSISPTAPPSQMTSILPTQDAVWTVRPTVPYLPPTPITQLDSRIAEFEEMYRIAFRNKNCPAPCQNRVVNVPDGRPLTLGDIVERLGPPDTVIAYVAGGGERQDIFAEVFYITKGVSFSVWRPIDPLNEITPNMLVSESILFQSRTREGIIVELEKLFRTTFMLSESQNWTGFGPIKMHNRR